MNQSLVEANEWSIIESKYSPENVVSAESLFSLGNGAMGQRANFEENYSKDTFQGSYIAGVYYPDKTKVGWWKNGYPEYFAKVLNAPNWIGIEVLISGEELDIAAAAEVLNFRRELNMKEGWYCRTFEVILNNGAHVKVKSTRFLSLALDEVGAIAYEITPLKDGIDLEIRPYIDSGIKNRDSNWDDAFWSTTEVTQKGNRAFIEAHTNKTKFYTCTFMQSNLEVGQRAIKPAGEECSDSKVSIHYVTRVNSGQTARLTKFGGYTVSRYHSKENLVSAANEALDKASGFGFKGLLDLQKSAWAEIWERSDIEIKGDVKAQQGIRYNIFHLNQTYLGKDPDLNIGPKGFTGEKYGGSTYWDTEAYCLPFYMVTKSEEVARNLLAYRYRQLDKAIANAKMLGFTGGAALYPMVTMNGEECHNEWEITFEEIHRNGAIAFAIFNYVRFTGDYSYIPEMGLEVLIAIARFWKQRVNYSEDKKAYVMLGVTGPNEYENNVNNNWYTNYIAKWCLQYTKRQVEKVQDGYPEDYQRVIGVTKLTNNELSKWEEIAENMYFPYSESKEVFLQQDGFLDKVLKPVSELGLTDRPINQKWSWDRILRSPYIKQADVLQGFYFFEDHFTAEQLEKHFDFYEPLTVHESSLSPCIHSIQAAKLGRMDQAYQLYLRTSRLDLDDYNKEVHQGLHITSMAGTWLSIIEGFAGLRLIEDKLHFNPQIPQEWDNYKFSITFRSRTIEVEVSKNAASFTLRSAELPMSIRIKGERIELHPEKKHTYSL
jgi:maltose phosphorylase